MSHQAYFHLNFDSALDGLALTQESPQRATMANEQQWTSIDMPMASQWDAIAPVEISHPQPPVTPPRFVDNAGPSDAVSLSPYPYARSQPVNPDTFCFLKVDEREESTQRSEEVDQLDRTTDGEGDAAMGQDQPDSQRDATPAGKDVAGHIDTLSSAASDEEDNEDEEPEGSDVVQEDDSPPLVERMNFPAGNWGAGSLEQLTGEFVDLLSYSIEPTLSM
ncbi:MAG TPA: hypothetical protein VGO47_01165 [Chlamydiales bacterium]|nr:hypothetical protein [Chlamydiales bacterium]